MSMMRAGPRHPAAGVAVAVAVVEPVPARRLLMSLVLVSLSTTALACDAGETRAAAAAAQAGAEARVPSPAAATRSADARQTTRPASTTRPADQDQAAPPDRLLGTWVADDVDTQMGDVKVKLTFRKDNDMKLMAWSDVPLVGKVRDKEAEYTVDGDTISSKAIRGGTSVKYRFDDGRLVIEYKDGKTVRFHREK